MTEGRVVHAYAVVPGAVAEAPAPQVLPPSGIAGSSVRVLPLEGLGVVVGDLDAERFGERAWQEHAEDPEWLEPVARGHHEVLRAVASNTDLLPLRLPGIYADDDSVRRALQPVQQSLGSRLALVSGHEEWGVHVHLLAEMGEQPAPSQAAPTSGRDYLAQRKRAVDERDTARDQRQRLLAEAYDALADAATFSVLNRPQDRALSGRAEPMLLNSAHLVARDRLEGFLARADELSRRLLEPAGLVMEISGPWPPYNFAVPLEEDGSPEDEHDR